jgi:glutamate racemase
VHIVLTDSGLGGLAVCAGLEDAVRRAGPPADLRLTYVNAWPEAERGYNDFPEVTTRAAVFDRALAAIDALGPDLIVIACNTLSILYEATAHRRAAAVPALGIIDAGVAMFAEALRARPEAALVLTGTRTTIQSGVHAEALRARGVAAERVGAASCHGLAGAIENGPASERTAGLIAQCARNASDAAPPGTPLLLGLCCTHYGFVADGLRADVARASGRDVEVLDPNRALVHDLLPRALGAAAFTADRRPPTTPVPVRMLSKVALSSEKRDGVAALLHAISPATARALRECDERPALF